MLYLIVSNINIYVAFVFAMLGLGGGMVYLPILKRAGFPMNDVAFSSWTLIERIEHFLH